jgi:putative MFS transporter
VDESSPAPTATTGLSRSQRLDRLPFTRRHGRLLAGSGVGWALDAMDVGLVSFVLAALAAQWSLSPGQLSAIASIGFVGMAVGASLGGLLADRIGRRQVFALTLLIYGLATGASALVTGVGLLLVLRFVVGLGLGAELPVASTLVSEYAPARIRGRIVVALEAFWALGWLLAAVIGYLVVPSSAAGWRWAFALGMVPALYAVVVRWGLPESVRFLERRGREAEAETAVRSFESAAGVEPPTDQQVAATVEHQPAAPWKELWSAENRRRTIALWLTWFGTNFSYYGAFIWLPTLLVASGFTLVKSFEYTLIITLAQLPGYAVSAYLIERWGRRPTLATFLAGSALSAVAFGLADSVPAVLATGMALSFFNLGAWGALYAVTPEVYPTDLRATGAGSAAAFGRIASIIAPLLVPLLRSSTGLTGLFVVFAVSFAVAALAALALPEWRGRALQD